MIAWIWTEKDGEAAFVRPEARVGVTDPTEAEDAAGGCLLYPEAGGELVSPPKGDESPPGARQQRSMRPPPEAAPPVALAPRGTGHRVARRCIENMPLYEEASPPAEPPQRVSTGSRARGAIGIYMLSIYPPHGGGRSAIHGT